VALNVAPLLTAHDISVLIDFLLFGATLACVAIFHRHALAAALIGLGAITIKKLLGTGFAEGTGLTGLYAHFAHEWVLLANLFLLLVGFAVLARQFEVSRVPDRMPAALPDDWTGGFVLLTLVFVLSSFLDNIAGALIGATVARHVFKGGVRVGYLAALVAAANAGAPAAFSVTRRPQCSGSPALAHLPCLMPISRLCARCSFQASRHRLPNINSRRSSRMSRRACESHSDTLPWSALCSRRRSAPMSERISLTPTFWTRSR
jgi:hypothetical protein